MNKIFADIEAAFIRGEITALHAGDLKDIQKTIGKIKFQFSDLGKTLATEIKVASELLQVYVESSEKLPESAKREIDAAKLRVDRLEAAAKAAIKFGIPLEGVTAETVEQAANIRESVKHLEKSAEFSKQLGQVWGVVTSGGGDFKDIIEKIANQAGRILLVAMAFKNLADAQDKFRTVGYRASGSAIELTSQVSMLKLELGLTQEEAEAVTLALAGLSLPGSVLKALVTEVGQFVKITGASAESTAKLSRRLVAMTGNTEDAVEVMNSMAVAAKDAGLTAADLDSLIGKLNETVFTMSALFGKSNAKKFAKELAEVAGAAKKAGTDAEAVTAHMTDMIREPLKYAAFLGPFFKEFTNPMTDLARKQEIIGIRSKKWLDTYKKSPEVAESLAQGIARTNSAMVEQLSLTAEQMKLDQQTKKEREKMGAVAKLIGDAYDQSAAGATSFWDALKKLGAQIMALIELPLLPILNALSFVLNFLSGVISGLSKWLGGLIDDFQNLGAGAVWITTTIKWTIGALMAWWIVKKLIFSTLSKGLSIIGDTAKGFANMGKAAANSSKQLSSIANSSKQVTAATSKMKPGAGIGAFLKNLGQGIADFFTAFRTVKPSDIVKFAFIMLIMVAALGALVFIAKQLGTEGIPALIALGAVMIMLSVAMWLVTPALLALGTAGWAVVLPLTVLGLVLAVVVVAVALLTYAFADLVRALVEAATIGPQFIDFLMQFTLWSALAGIAFVVLGTGILAGMTMIALAAVIGLGAAPFLILAAGAIWVFGAAIGYLSDAMGPTLGTQMLLLGAGLTAIASIGFFKIIKAGAGLRKFSAAVSAAVRQIATAAPFLPLITQITKVLDQLAASLQSLSNINMGETIGAWMDAIMAREGDFDAVAALLEKFAERIFGAASKIATTGDLMAAFNAIVARFEIAAVPPQPIVTAKIDEGTARQEVSDERRSREVTTALDRIAKILAEARETDEAKILIEIKELMERYLPKLEKATGSGFATRSTQYF